MTNIDPSLLGSDELYLSGRIQIDTAIDVLQVCSTSTLAIESLSGLRDAHELLTPDGEEAMDDLKIFLSGGNTSEIKQAIITSALLARSNRRLSVDVRSAAAGLLSVLGIEA
jgi:hypothetical protein